MPEFMYQDENGSDSLQSPDCKDTVLLFSWQGSKATEAQFREGTRSCGGRIAPVLFKVLVLRLSVRKTSKFRQEFRTRDVLAIGDGSMLGLRGYIGVSARAYRSAIKCL